MEEDNNKPSGLLADIANFRGKLNKVENPGGMSTGKFVNTVRPVTKDILFDDKTEFYDEPSDLRSKVVTIAEQLRQAKHAVAYTGAGISTSAKLPDYRGPKGLWTLKEQGLTPTAIVPSLEEIQPTLGHMALLALQKAGYIKYLVSTNIDGLHYRSGFPTDKLSELHGNAYIEKCPACAKTFLRKFDTSRTFSEGFKPDHKTGRACESCGGDLVDSIVHFGEPLPDDPLNAAWDNADKSDFALVIGTSMTVQPASLLPEPAYRKNGGKMVICNLQKTPQDSKASMKVGATCDDFLCLLCAELDVEIFRATPEGYELPIFFDDIDVRYTDMRVKLAEKAHEKQKQMETFGGHKSKNTFIVGDADKNETLSPTNLLLLQNCHNCNYVIGTKCLKVIMENCENVTLDIPNPVVTSCLEIINCKNVKFEIKVHMLTVSTDGCDGVDLKFAAPKFYKAVYVSGSERVTVTVVPLEPITMNCTELCQLHPESATVRFPQFVLHPTEERLEVEFVVREGAGYATTQREKDDADERDRRNLKAMELVMNKMFSIGPKEDKK